jgi:hypothetical protein
MSVLTLGVGIGDLVFFNDCQIATPQGWSRHYAFASIGHGSLLQHDCSHGFSELSRLGSLPHASEWVALWLMMLLRLTLLHRDATTTVLALFPLLRLIFLLLCVFGRITMATLLPVVTSTTSGHKAHHANVDAACAGAAKSAYGSHACRAHASSNPISAHA